MSRRKFSIEEKLAILKEAEANGITQTIRRRGLKPGWYGSASVRCTSSRTGAPVRFSHVATPQDNGHIESYRAAHRHHFVKRAVCNVYEFLNLGEASEIVRRFGHFYNGERLHSGIGYLSPNKYFFKLGLEMPSHYQGNDVKVDYSKNVNLYQFVESVSKKLGVRLSTFKGYKA